jgi:hypothetical protein
MTGMMAILMWMALAYPSFDGRPNYSMFLFFPTILPFGVIVTLPLTVFPTLAIGAMLSALKRARPFRPTWTRVLVGGTMGGLVGYDMMLPSIESFGSAIPGLLMGSAITATWPFFDPAPVKRARV